MSEFMTKKNISAIISWETNTLSLDEAFRQIWYKRREKKTFSDSKKSASHLMIRKLTIYYGIQKHKNVFSCWYFFFHVLFAFYSLEKIFRKSKLWQSVWHQKNQQKKKEKK